MPDAQKLFLVKALRSEPAEAWRDTQWGCTGRTGAMDFARDLVASAAAEWGWFSGGAIKLRLRFGPVFHLGDAGVERVLRIKRSLKARIGVR